MTVQLPGHARGRSPQASRSAAAPAGSRSRLAPPSPPAPRPSLPAPPRPVGKAAPLRFSGSLHPDPVLSPPPRHRPSGLPPAALTARTGRRRRSLQRPRRSDSGAGRCAQAAPRGVSRATGRSGRAGQGGFRSGLPRRGPQADSRPGFGISEGRLWASP